jgi:hypothetical protein
VTAGFSTTYELTEGGVRLTVADLDGTAFSVDFTVEEAVDNLRAFARTLGLVVAAPL